MKRVYTIALILTAVFSTEINAQNLRQWMPNVGDRFVYLQHSFTIDYVHGYPNGPGEDMIDTIFTEIVSIDSNYDLAHQHLVVEKQYHSFFLDTVTMFYNFFVGQNAGSVHPFDITVYDGFCTYCSEIGYDFSRATDTEVTFDSEILTAYIFLHDSITNQGGPIGLFRSTAVYSPQLHWFYSFSDSSNEPTPDYSYAAGSNKTSLLYASTFPSKVEERSIMASLDLTNQTGNLLRVTLQKSDREPSRIILLDPVGRPIRSWQMPVGAGERQLTLNVANVPSGIYFLRVSGTGFDEVKKVMIAQ